MAWRSNDAGRSGRRRTGVMQAPVRLRLADALVEECGWTPRDAERWSADVLRVLRGNEELREALLRALSGLPESRSDYRGSGLQPRADNLG